MITRTSGHIQRAAVLAVATISLGLLTTPGPANADAVGKSGFGGCYDQNGICIPRGEMSINTASVGGSGNRIKRISAGFIYLGQISNLWIDHDFLDAKGNPVPGGHIQGEMKYGNFSTNTQGWNWGNGYYTAPSHGWHCATLYSQQPEYIKTWKKVCNRIG